MDITKKIFNVALIAITAVLTLMSCVYFYFITLGKNKLPSAITSTYATFVTDPQTNEKLPAIEANYYSNKSGNGEEVVELLFNCYSGISKQAIYSRGFQLVYEEDTNSLIQGVTVPKLYCYDRHGGGSFLTGHEYNFEEKKDDSGNVTQKRDSMLIDIDGETYAVALDGTYELTTKKFSFLKAFGHTFVGLFNGYDYSKYAYNEETTKHNYTMTDLLVKIKNILKSSSNGTGNGIIPLIDLGDFLHIYSVDDKGQVSANPIGDGTLINSYFTVQAHYDYRGMVWAKQSMFKSVAGDSSFNISGIADNVEYWKVTNEVTLTQADFEKRYVTNENGYYFSLTQKKLKELKSFENLEINIVFDISKFEDLNVLGFDYYALYGIKVNSLKITAPAQRDFRLLVGSLKDTGLTSIDTTNVKIININSGVTL